MKFNKVTVLVFLGCATFVLASAQAPPDDDDFDFDGSGFVVGVWPTSTAAPAGRGAPSWYEPPEEPTGSGSGDRADDDEDYDDDDYVYDYDYGYSEKEDEKPEEVTTTQKPESKPVGVVHSIPPVTEKTAISEHKPSLGTEPRPEPKEPAQTDDINNYDSDYAPSDTDTDTDSDTDTDTDSDSDSDSDAAEEPDLVLSPEVTQEMEDMQKELQDVEQRQRELEQELEQEREQERERAGEMDGLGTKALDRDTSFFAQPGILAAVVGGAVVGLLCAILLVMLIVYRMRKKDEGSYPVDEPAKRSLTGNGHNKNKEFYA